MRCGRSESFVPSTPSPLVIPKVVKEIRKSLQNGGKKEKNELKRGRKGKESN